MELPLAYFKLGLEEAKIKPGTSRNMVGHLECRSSTMWKYRGYKAPNLISFIPKQNYFGYAFKLFSMSFSLTLQFQTYFFNDQPSRYN